VSNDTEDLDLGRCTVVFVIVVLFIANIIHPCLEIEELVSRVVACTFHAV
jgi:hypothetical protein